MKAATGLSDRGAVVGTSGAMLSRWSARFRKTVWTSAVAGDGAASARAAIESARAVRFVSRW